MNFNSEQSSNGKKVIDYPSCLYNAMHPYSIYANSLSQNINAAQIELYAKETMMHHISTPPYSSLGQTVYPQNFQMPGNELSGFPSTSTALENKYGLLYGTSMPALNPTVQMTTDYNGLWDASNPLKCPKQVHPFYWRKKGNCERAEGMTRTRDKYRVVYTDKQRVGLEKAFRENKFITLEKKKEISKELDLSERQIKIWFQNRRAKERRQRRKAETEQDETEEDENTLPHNSDTAMDDAPKHSVSGTVQPKDDLTDVGVHIPTHSYSVLHSLEKPCVERQCRFQPTTGNTTFENENVPTRQQDQSEQLSANSVTHGIGRACSDWQQDQTGKRSQQDQIGRRLSASPPEWVYSNDIMTTCNISPFSANPDFNLLYRT